MNIDDAKKLGATIIEDRKLLMLLELMNWKIILK